MEQLFDAALSSKEASETTILIGRDSIRIIADSDWPLDSLLLDSGARFAYRITADVAGLLRVEGREGSRRCVMEARAPAEVARMLLGA